jgi:hypothetical protein
MVFVWYHSAGSHISFALPFGGPKQQRAASKAKEIKKTQTPP